MDRKLNGFELHILTDNIIQSIPIIQYNFKFIRNVFLQPHYTIGGLEGDAEV